MRSQAAALDREWHCFHETLSVQIVGLKRAIQALAPLWLPVLHAVRSLSPWCLLFAMRPPAIW